MRKSGGSLPGIYSEGNVTGLLSIASVIVLDRTILDGTDSLVIFSTTFNECFFITFNF